MKLKDLVKQSGGSGSDLWNIPVDLLDCNPANIRLDGPALRDHIAGLAESIQERGFLRARPLTVRQDGDRLIVVDGNCRLLAVRIAMEKGAEIKTLPCLSEAPNTSDADRTLNMLLANSGMAHTPVEYAAAINRLLSYGWTDADVAKKLGKSRQWIANTLETAALPEDAQVLIAEGVASATTVRQMVRAGGAGAVATIRQAASTTGRSHVTARHLRVVASEPDKNTTPVTIENAAIVSAMPCPGNPVVSDDLTLAVRRFLTAWDSDDGVTDAIMALRRMVS